MSAENTPEGRVRQLVIQRRRQVYVGIALALVAGLFFSTHRHANFALVGLAVGVVLLLVFRLRCPRCERFLGLELWTANRCRHCLAPFDGRRHRP